MSALRWRSGEMSTRVSGEPEEIEHAKEIPHEHLSGIGLFAGEGDDFQAEDPLANRAAGNQLGQCRVQQINGDAGCAGDECGQLLQAAPRVARIIRVNDDVGRREQHRQKIEDAGAQGGA